MVGVELAVVAAAAAAAAQGAFELCPPVLSCLVVMQRRKVGWRRFDT